MILTTVYKIPQGILLKLVLENLEISGNFVLKIGWTPCYIYDGFPLGFNDTCLLGNLLIPVCRHMLKHSSVAFTQHPQSQLVVYAVITFEQILITVI